MTVVIDSNLLIVLVHADPRSEVTQQQFDEWFNREIDIHTPELAKYEIANGLTRLINAGLFPREQLATAWSLLNNLPITYHAFSQANKIIEVALSLNRQSAYDAAYIVLAESLEAQLWTLDTPLYRNAVGRGYQVRLVGKQSV